MLTDDEAGRVKLTRVAVNVGKVPLLVSVSGSQQQQHWAACIAHGNVAGMTFGIFPAACSHSVIIFLHLDQHVLSAVMMLSMHMLQSSTVNIDG